MTDSASAGLRLFVEEPPEEPAALCLPQSAALFRAFEQATGWHVGLEQAPPGPGEVWSTTIDTLAGQRPSRLVLRPAAHEEQNSGTASPPIDLHLARPLALAIGGFLGEFNRVQRAVWQREAELAAGVPVAIRAGDEPHLAERLEGVIKSGAEAVGCQAAGLYLLDEHTSHLKLRAAWNLPRERFLAEPLPLRGAIADLEALVGHAVVLEDTSVLPHWRCPEDFPAAVCVPVSSSTTPLGTLWVFSGEKRDFSPEETNLVEIIAGRLASDLEREMLLAAGLQLKTTDRQLDAAARWLSARLPSVMPLAEGYEVAGWTQQAAEIGGAFHDWSVLPDGRLALAAGAAAGQGAEAALGAASLHATIKSHTGYRHTAAELLSRVNQTLYTSSPGDQRASLAYALIDPDRGAVDLALAGSARAHVIGKRNRPFGNAEIPQLGESLEAVFPAKRMLLGPAETLLLVSGAQRVDDSVLPAAVSANQTVERLREQLANRTNDRAAVVLKRQYRGH
ncbi:MAG TPA: SpoIIE family protein phosphatase [Pirellulaceae bacterium]|nr:SpoIIE family protein phosphatase [Pirellulaceae bacterium]